MKTRYLLSTLLVLMLAQTAVWGQSGGSDFLRSTGKIYVVVAVIATIFVGIVLFLIFLDRRLTKIENQINDHGE